MIANLLRATGEFVLMVIIRLHVNVVLVTQDIYVKPKSTNVTRIHVNLVDIAMTCLTVIGVVAHQEHLVKIAK